MNYVRLDELDLAAQPRMVSEGGADGVHWSIRAECDRAGVLCTVVTYTCEGASATFSVLGASLHNGQLLSLWVGRERDARDQLGHVGVDPVRAAAPREGGAVVAVDHEVRLPQLDGHDRRKGAVRERVLE